MPSTSSPQLATLVDAAAGATEWLHEIKYDGYRALCGSSDGEARLITRNGKDWTDRFAPVAAAAEKLPVRPGAPRRRGRGAGAGRHHQLPGAAERPRRGPAGRPRLLRLRPPLPRRLRPAPRAARRPQGRRWRDLLAGRRAAACATATTSRADGEDFFRQACGFALEGIVSKRADLPYHPAAARTGSR